MGFTKKESEKTEKEGRALGKARSGDASRFFFFFLSLTVVGSSLNVAYHGGGRSGDELKEVVKFAEDNGDRIKVCGLFTHAGHAFNSSFKSSFG